jgi:micrococcal nuclease
MCGRFTQRYTWREVHDFLDLRSGPRNLRPRYNIAPTTAVDVVRATETGRGDPVEHHIGGAGRVSECGARCDDGMIRFGLLALPLLLLAAAPSQAQQRCRVVDGDTIGCGEERVRIMGLDTPEMSARCPREERLARAATARMSDLIAGGVTLQPHCRDRYHRLLAVVRDRQGRDVAQIMIREGHARAYDGGRRAGWCEPGG